MAPDSIPTSTFSSVALPLTRSIWRMATAMLLVLVSLFAKFANGQEQKVPSQERDNVQHAISSLSACLRSRQTACVAESISSRGVTLGVDGPRSSKKSLVQQLFSDKSVQCLFWGTDCDSSVKCSVASAMANVEASDISKQRLYGRNWQVDVQPKPIGPCDRGLPFVFQLEEGHWKLLAIPYT